MVAVLTTKSVLATPVNPDPSPSKFVAVTTPVTLIPASVNVIADPILIQLALTIPVTVKAPLRT